MAAHATLDFDWTDRLYLIRSFGDRRTDVLSSEQTRQPMGALAAE